LNGHATIRSFFPQNFARTVFARAATGGNAQDFFELRKLGGTGGCSFTDFTLGYAVADTHVHAIIS
jgi:hypothetical protein